MDIPQYLNLGIKKYLWSDVENHRWARAIYIELAEQMQALIAITDKSDISYQQQLGVVLYLAKKLDAYLTLKKVP